MKKETTKSEAKKVVKKQKPKLSKEDKLILDFIKSKNGDNSKYSLAKSSGLSQNMVGKFLRGENGITARSFLRICATLDVRGVELVELLKKINEK